MTRPPSEAVDLTRLSPHLQEHLLHVGQPKPFFIPRPAVLIRSLARRPPIGEIIIAGPEFRFSSSNRRRPGLS